MPGTRKSLALGALGAAGIYGGPKVVIPGVLGPVSAWHWR